MIHSKRNIVIGIQATFNKANVHTPKDWPTVAIEFTSNDISIEIPNAVKDAKPIKGIKIWRANPSSKEIRNLLSGK